MWRSTCVRTASKASGRGQLRCTHEIGWPGEASDGGRCCLLESERRKQAWSAWLLFRGCLGGGLYALDLQPIIVNKYSLLSCLTFISDSNVLEICAGCCWAQRTARAACGARAIHSLRPDWKRDLLHMLAKHSFNVWVIRSEHFQLFTIQKWRRSFGFRSSTKYRCC